MAAFLTSPVSRLPWLAALLSLASVTWAGTTDISNQPLASLPSVSASPNLLLLLDSSGSMDSAYMPDDMSSTGRYGYYASQCNGVAYDPTHTYTPPLKADGTYYSNASFTAAWDDGYTQTSTTNLNTKFYYTYSGSQTAMSWTYTSDGVTQNTFYNECWSARDTSTTAGASPGVNVFTKVLTSSLTAAQQTNYANWYSYYRKRYLLMRTAMGQAMQTLNPGGASPTPDATSRNRFPGRAPTRCSTPANATTRC
jgi:type IV pilus assembly protein PilY1